MYTNLIEIDLKIFKFCLIFLLIILYFICLYLKYNINQNKIKVIAISYSDSKFKRQLEINKISALEVGKVDEYYSYMPDDIDENFKNKNYDILSRKRGNGYWLWKPYFILKTLKDKLNDGDYLIYSDAGIYYTNKTSYVINILKENNIDIWLYQLNYKEKMYTKRDAFILMEADNSSFSETLQYMGGIQIYRKSKLSEQFAEKLLFYSQDKRIITDEPNSKGYQNYDGFIENRHDQTVVSLLYKKYGILNSLQQKIVMPKIFCVYRGTPFIDYNDIKKKCREIH